MKIKGVLFLAVVFIGASLVFFLAKTPPMRLKDPSAAKLAPSFAVLAIQATDAGKKWKTLLRVRPFREFVNSEGGKALKVNYILPLLDSFFPKKSAKHISGHFLKLLKRDFLFSKYEGAEGDGWFFTARINTRQKIGFRFMRRYLTKKSKLIAVSYEGIPFYEITVSPGRKLYHAVVGNFVIFTPDGALMQQSLSLAAGKDTDSLFERKELCEKGFASCSASGDASSPLLNIFLLPPADAEANKAHEVFHVLDFADKDKARTTFKIYNAAPGAAHSGALDFTKASLLLPKDTAFLVTVDFSAPLRHGESLQAFLEKPETLEFAKNYFNLNVLKELLPFLEGNGILASTKVRALSDETPLPDFMLLLPVKKTANPKETQKAVLSAVHKIFSQGMKQSYKRKESAVYGTRVTTYRRDKSGEGAVLAPSYAFFDNVLAVTLSRDDMEKLLAVRKGYLPCLKDAESFEKMQIPQDAKLYFYASGDKLPDYLSDYLTKLVPASSGFLEKEIKGAFIPFVKEFNRFSAFKAAMFVKGNTAEGNFEFVFKKP